MVGSTLIFLCLFLVTVIGLIFTSDFDRYPTRFFGRPGDPEPPAWTKTCRRGSLASGNSYVLSCARVHGRAIYVQGQDPDGDGDAHAVVVAGPRLVIVKYRPGSDGPVSAGVDVPSIGDMVTAAGTVTRGRNGLTAIDPFRRRR